jgi:hypothetical protein
MPICDWFHTPLRGLSNTGRPAATATPAAESPPSATANSPTPTTNHGNDAHSPKAGDHQPPNPPPKHNITKYY